MKSLKIIIAAGILAITSSVCAKAVLDKTYLKSLDGHQTYAVKLTLPAGKTMVTVETDTDAVISCKFINSNGIVGLEVNNVGRCWGNVEYSMDDSMTVKVTNETDSLVDVRVHQVTKDK
jgi:hypothetical protein